MRTTNAFAALMLLAPLAGCHKEPHGTECGRVRREVAAAKLEGMQRAVREARRGDVSDETQFWASLDATRRARLRTLRLTDRTLRALVLDYDRAEGRLYDILRREGVYGRIEPSYGGQWLDAEQMWSDAMRALTDYQRSIDALTAYCKW